MTDQLLDDEGLKLLTGDGTAHPPVRSTPTAADDETPQNYFPTVAAFVSGFLVDAYAHEVTDQLTAFRWCSQWWQHPAAVARLEAMWKAWESLRTDPGAGSSTWFVTHGDPAITYLTAPDGPFQRCSDTTHRPTPALPLTAPPPGVFLEPIPPTAPG